MTRDCAMILGETYACLRNISKIRLRTLLRFQFGGAPSTPMQF
jgi:hypothetical protein